MAESSLQERLRDHAKAFDGLLSLIPAKYYYGEDTSDQWKKKKQTKEEAAAAKRAKLDPDSVKSAKDVMDERARKRKLEEGDESDIDGVEKELPKQGLKVKKQKTEAETPKKDNKTGEAGAAANAGDTEEAKKARLEQKKLKKQEKRDKLVKKTEQKKAKRANAAAQLVDLGDDDAKDIEVEVEGLEADADEDQEQKEADEERTGDKVEKLELNGLADDEEQDAASSATPSPDASPVFDQSTAAEPSANTSTSSTIPPATAPKHIKMPTDPELLKQRLAARIEALRAARKADGPNGAPARNRQELMEGRRKKEEQRRAHKKELRLKAKIEEEARREEALASARDSPASSLMSPALHTAGPDNNFSFGRVAFSDGQQLTSDLSGLQAAPRKRGPQDPKTALEASEKKRLRLSGLDETKRADIEEKDIWLSAKKRAQGEKVRDDSSLLKKTLKRKEKMKKKSEKEWGERKEGIAKSQAMKQKKREGNLQKRKDEKGGKGKGKGKTGGVKKGGKPKSRPGFEGGFGGSRKK